MGCKLRECPNKLKKDKEANVMKAKKIIIGVAAGLITLIAAGAIVVNAKLSKIHYTNDLPENEVVTNDMDKETEKKLSGYTNVALFGLDNRSNGDLNTGRSDTMIVASINNDTKEIKLLSVYRDSYLDTDGDMTLQKCNAAYEKGGVKQAVNMLNRNLDLNISNYVSVDFNALIDIVDALGGIELDITEEEEVLINGYAEEITNVTGKKSDVIEIYGPVTLNGVQATAYCRIRYTAGSDFKRTERQRLVLEKIFDKVKKSDILTLNKIVDTVLDEVYTNFSKTEILKLISALMDYKLGDTSGFPFAMYTDTLGSKGSVVIPATLSDNVTALHKFLFDDDNYKPSNQVVKISKAIVSDTGVTADMAVSYSNDYKVEKHNNDSGDGSDYNGKYQKESTEANTEETQVVETETYTQQATEAVTEAVTETVPEETTEEVTTEEETTEEETTEEVTTTEETTAEVPSEAASETKAE
mgnify:FL=1